MNVTLTCQRCSNEFQTDQRHASTAKYCPDCRPIVHVENNALRKQAQKPYINIHSFDRVLTKRQRSVRDYIAVHPGCRVSEIASGLGLKYTTVLNQLLYIQDLCEDEKARLWVYKPEPIDHVAPRRWQPKMAGRSL